METITVTQPYVLGPPTVGRTIARTDGTFIVREVVDGKFNPRMRGCNYTYTLRVERTESESWWT